MPHPIILHHFDASPFSEKIRVIFGFKGLSWSSVRIPRIMPKPDLMPLTGGYRRTPVMQIGADIFCDTQIIIREIERRFPSPTLFPSGGAGLPWALGMWTDRPFFQSAVNLAFGALGHKVPQEFIDDRSALRGARFDVAKMRAAIPQMRDQVRAYLGWIEAQLHRWADMAAPRLQPRRRQRLHERLVRPLRPCLARGSGGRGAGEDFRPPAARRGMGEPGASGRTRAARGDVGRAGARRRGQGKPGNDAPKNDPDDPNGRKVGDKVVVVPEDYGKVEVGGEIVSLSAQHIAIRRADERVGEIVVHFPRAGFLVLEG